MKKNIFFNIQKQYSSKFEYNSYKWFFFHKLLHRSLIFKGLKLWAIKFINNLKWELKMRENCDTFWLILISFLKLMPTVYLFPKKLGRRVQGVPLPITESKQYMYIIKWTIKFLRKKHKRISISLLTDLIISSLYNKGEALDQKKEMYQTSTSNRHLVRFFKR